MHGIIYSYNIALMQCHTCMTLFHDSTNLLERATLNFAIMEEITIVTNDILSRSFCKYRLLKRL